jgi:CobQ-like glutamine amidotransferase family enzyme
MNDYKITILHLYPDLLNLYGDKGNIECMRKRLEWRGIDVEVVSCTAENDCVDFDNADIIFLGGGSDREQELVCHKLIEKKDKIAEYVENGGSMVAVCGGFQLLGKYYQLHEKKIEGLGILDIHTDKSLDGSRLIGDVIIECEGLKNKVVGFENHSGRTDIGNHMPLGKVIKGHGNNETSGFEGVVYKNVKGTYLHGPLFPKNPELCDKFLLTALMHKYKDFKEFAQLDNEIETKASEYMQSRI